MKPLLFLVMIIALTSCNGFEHLHYRKLKKVPATGWVEERTPASRENMRVAIPEAENDSVTSVTGQVIKDTAGFPRNNNKHAYKMHSSTGKIHKKIRPVEAAVKKRVEQKKQAIIRKRGDGSVFLVFLFLILGLWLLVTGIVMIVIGINAIVWWLIILGLVVFFLGLMPFLGIISLAFAGDRYHPLPAYDESQKHSVFPDHQ